MIPLSQDIIKVPSEISDRCATVVYIPFEHALHGTFTGNVWINKFANDELFNKKYFIKVLSMKQVHYLQMLKGVSQIFFQTPMYFEE